MQWTRRGLIAATFHSVRRIETDYLLIVLNKSLAMGERIAKVACVAVGSGVLAFLGLVCTSSLDFFAPCRVLYRVRQEVQESLACQSYSAITVASALFFFATLGFALAAVVLVFLRRRAVPAKVDRVPH